MTKEQKFFKALQDVFIGAKIEGTGGFVNLMKIKSNYYRKIEELLKQDIEKALKKYPDFRDELFDKLYSFFNRYFTESGSIYFNSTPFHNNIYEKVYTDEKDVILFWKTQMLYYVKTDRIFRSLEIDIPPDSPLNKGGMKGGIKFFFDVSNLEHKKANEKRRLIYELKEVKEDKTIVLNVIYSEKGRVTKVDDILKSLKKQGISITEEQLERAFRVFEKQSEVDFFINKNAKAFLQEQFKLWSYQYFWDGAKEWTADRVNELQILKDIAFKIIDFISQFEDELVKIWNKPKFVKNSNYVVTLDRLNNLELVEKIFTHVGIEEQIKEWKELGIVDENFTPEEIFENIEEKEWEIYNSNILFKDELHKDGLITTGYHLPYNPKLVEAARQLRKNLTDAEKKLWNGFLRKFKYPVLRQRPIHHFIVDFYCAKLKLVIEIDGEQHYTEEGKAYDEERTRILESYGLRVIRFKNKDVFENFDEVCKKIDEIPPLSPLNKGGMKGGIKQQFRHLPIDTKYFKDLELEILSQFDNLDQALDDWLIKSENYQALNTILPKFKEKVQTIYIDPPYNTGSDEFVYADKFQYSSWLTMMENRLYLAKEMINSKGNIFVSIGDTIKKEIKVNSVSRLQLLLNFIFGEDNYMANFIRKSGIAPRQDIKHIANAHDYVLLYAKNQENVIINKKTADTKRLKYKDSYFEIRGYFDLNQLDRGSIQYSESLDYPINIKKGEIIEVFDGQSFKKIEAPENITIYPGQDPNDKRWIFRWSKSKVLWGIENDFIVFRKDKNDNWKVYYKEYELVDNEGKPRERMNPYDTLILDFYNEIGNSEIENFFGKRLFEYPKPSDLIKHLIQIGTSENSLVVDFFAGSGTTAHAILKFNKEDGGKRKFILTEMGDYFYKVIIPRLKKIAYSFNWKNGKPENNEGVSLFFKYYELEQYEETLANTVYENHDLFIVGDKSPYEQYVFMKDEKMLRALEIDYENNKVKVNLDKIIPPVSPLSKEGNIPPVSPLSKGGMKGGIDIAETLSNLTGKWIKKIYEDKVEFEDGMIINTKDLDYKLIKPLIWWE